MSGEATFVASAMPDLDGVRAALAAFRAAVRTADPAALACLPAARLHAECAELVDSLTEARDAALALARSAGSTWECLERTSGVADSTLRDRLTRWEEVAR
jgi:hypothetical protein